MWLDMQLLLFHQGDDCATLYILYQKRVHQSRSDRLEGEGMKGLKLEKIYPYTYEADAIRLDTDRFSYEGTYLLLSLVAPTIWIETNPCTMLGFPPETIDRISVQKKDRWFDLPIIDIRNRGKRSSFSLTTETDRL